MGFNTTKYREIVRQNPRLEFLSSGAIFVGKINNFYGNFFMTLVLTGLFAGFLIDKGYAIAALNLAFLVLTLVFLVLASFTDPGIIPQVIATEDEKVPKRNALDNLTQATQGFAFETNTFSVSTRFCKICRIYRPPRAAHCFECHHCVEKFDHHCPWIGVCVGRKNYFFFFVYVASMFGLLVSNVAVGTWFVIRLGVDLDQTSTRSKDIAFMTITSLFVLASLGFGIFVTMLLGLHTWLIYNNKTTREHLKSFDENHPSNPFATSVTRTVKKFCTLSRKKTLLNKQIRSYSDIMTGNKLVAGSTS